MDYWFLKNKHCVNPPSVQTVLRLVAILEDSWRWMCLWSMKPYSENKLEPHKDKLKEILTGRMVTKLFLHFYSFIDVYAFHIQDLPQSWMKKIYNKISADRLLFE